MPWWVDTCGYRLRPYMFQSTRISMGLDVWSANPTPSGALSRGRLDHLVYNAPWIALCHAVPNVGPEVEAWPFGDEVYHWEAKEALGVDHVLISQEFLLSQPVLHRRRLLGCRRVGRYVVDKAAENRLAQLVSTGATVREGVLLHMHSLTWKTSVPHALGRWYP